MNFRAPALVFVLAIMAGPGYAGTLQDDVQTLLSSHPEIKAARNNVSAAGEGVDRAFAAYLPTFELFGDYGYEHTDSPGTRRSAGSDTLSTPRETFSATLNQSVFDGFRREADNSSARIELAIAELDLETTRQRVLFEGAATYLNVLRHARLVELSRRNERTIQIQLRLEDERVERGAGIAVDVLQAKSRLQISKERRVAFEGNLKDAFARFKQVFDFSAEIGGMTEPGLPLDLIPSSLDEAEKVALEDNPVLANSGRAVDLASERKRTAASPYYPDIDLVAQYNYEEDDEGVRGMREDYSIKIQGRWELFSGFATRADTADAAYRHLATLDRNAFVTRRTVEDVRLAWQQLETASQRVRLLENAVNIAIEVHTARMILRESGKDTVINVLDAENEVFNAQILAVGADFDAHIAIYRLMLGMGRMTPETVTQSVASGDTISVADWALGKY